MRNKTMVAHLLLVPPQSGKIKIIVKKTIEMCMIRWIFFVKYGIICTAYYIIVKLRAPRSSMLFNRSVRYGRYESLGGKLHACPCSYENGQSYL